METEIKKIQLSSLKEFPDNPQDVPTEKMTLIKRNMREKGWYGEIPLIWDNYIVSGNHRVQCALGVGIIEQNCIVITDEKYNWEQAKKDCIMFNTLHGDPDPDKLKGFIENILDEFDLDIEGIVDDIGMSEEDINGIFGCNEKELNDISDKINDVYEVVVECNSLEEQEKIFNFIKNEGYVCRLLTL